MNLMDLFNNDPTMVNNLMGQQTMDNNNFSQPAGNISDQIQQLLGAKQPTQPGITENILSMRNLPSQQDIGDISQRFQATPTAQDYAGGLNSILTGRFQGGQDIAQGRLNESLATLANLQKQQIELNQAPLKNQYMVSEINKNNALAESGKYVPIKDAFGSITGIMNGKTGEVQTYNPFAKTGDQNIGVDLSSPSSDPQTAAQQILAESGTTNTPVMSRQDVTGRNAQQLAYRTASTAAKLTLDNLNSLNNQTGKYSPGSVAGGVYDIENSLGMGGEGATAKTEADKASKNLANSLMQATAGAKGSGIRMVQFDAGAVPNSNMSDQARTDLINKNKATANLQVQRGIISDLYPRMSIANVNAIMDNYEGKNPPALPDGTANPNFLPYVDWLKAGRPNTATLALQGMKNPDISAPTTAQNLDMQSGTPIDIAPPDVGPLQNPSGQSQPSNGWAIRRVK